MLKVESTLVTITCVPLLFGMKRNRHRGWKAAEPAKEMKRHLSLSFCFGPNEPMEKSFKWHYIKERL